MTIPSLSRSDTDVPAWASLKKAIASSSGFQRWQLQSGQSGQSDDILDDLVLRYLRETLETLAY